MFKDAKWWWGPAGYLLVALTLVLIVPAAGWAIGAFIYRAFYAAEKPATK